MRRRNLLPALLCLLFINVYAQDKQGKITGTIVDGSQKNMASATITLINAKDSSVVKFTSSTKEGNYEFDHVSEGRFFVQVTIIGYEKANSDAIVISSANQLVKVPVIKLTEESKSLEAVTVTAKKPFIETKIDKTVVNVDASPTSAGSTAMEVLEKSPGISVDNDGNISLRGKAGVIVMMDGKPTYLSASDLATMLKNMPASALDQIEIMTNPSSKYDAAGNSGIINIKTKKGKQAGFNGSVMTSMTTSFLQLGNTLYLIPKTQNSINFNYHKNKWNLFGNYNPNGYRGKGELTINRNFYDNNGNVNGYSDVLTRFRFGNNNHTMKLGADFSPNKKTTYGVVLSGFVFSGHPTPVTTTTIADENHDPVSSMVSLTQNRIRFKNFSSNFNYSHQFDTTGTELTADLDYVTYSNVSNMLLTTNFYDAAGQTTADPLLLQGHLPSDINIYSLKSDYTHPFKKGGKLEAGIKSSYVSNDNLVDYNRFENNKWDPDSRSNHFVYDENINAAYINGNKQFGKWNLQAGLRLENTIAKGHQLTNDSTFKRNFTNLFPSVFASYELNKKNTITLSYSRRITRPNYQDLNPFTYFLDSLSYQQGNPYLLPEFTHNIELSHAYKGKFITTLNYTNTTDVIAEILKQNSQNKVVFATADNVAKFKNIGLSLTIPVSVTKWWNTNIFTNVFNNHYVGEYNGGPLDVSYTSFMVNITNTFTVKKGFTLEWSGWYRAKGVDELNISEPMYQMSIGGQKAVLKGKGTLRLNIRDPFAWQQYSGLTSYNNIYVKIHNKFDARQVTIGFIYRFGKATQQTPKRRSSGTQDEQSRVGGAG